MRDLWTWLTSNKIARFYLTMAIGGLGVHLRRIIPFVFMCTWAIVRGSYRRQIQKSAVGLGLGLLVTTCGLIAGAGPVAPLTGGMAVVATATFSAVSKRLEGD